MEQAELQRSTIAFPPAMQIFERGWLSANSVLFADPQGGTLIDTGHVSHKEQTTALVIYAVDRHENPNLRRIINTHLHADHCGANHHLGRLTVCDITIPEGYADAVRDWDLKKLSFEVLDQPCDVFEFHDTVAAGDVLTMGEREWQALAAPGHDGDSLMFHCADEGLLISGDALWEDGCGALFPSADPATLDHDFAQAFATLDLIDTLTLRAVIPGHGAPFVDAKGAVARARSRLDYLAADRTRNAWHVIKTLVKFRLLDRRRISLERLWEMVDTVPGIRFARRDLDLSREQIVSHVIDALVKKKAAIFRDNVLENV